MEKKIAQVLECVSFSMYKKSAYKNQTENLHMHRRCDAFKIRNVNDNENEK